MHLQLYFMLIQSRYIINRLFKITHITLQINSDILLEFVNLFISMFNLKNWVNSSLHSLK